MDRRSSVNRVSRESEEWRRTLAFLSQENSCLKLRLADILNGKDYSASFLEAAELYQNRFIQTDEIIKLLIHDLSMVDDLLTREVNDGAIPIEDVIEKQHHLRKQIRYLEVECYKLKYQFNNYLSELP